MSERPPADDRDTERILVEDAAGRRPFMRGIMVHSLMARGIAFEDALQTADEVRRRIAGSTAVPRTELAKMVREILGSDLALDHQPPLPVPGRIFVTRRGRDSLPFSKGVLSQSLVAAAISPKDAFGAAEEIEEELLRRGLHEVDRRELRELACDALLHRFGRQTAERYLVWRRHQEPEKPVILLLGGTTGCGKTSLALEVAQRLGISRVVSTDSIRQILRITLSKDLVPAIHSSSFDAYTHMVLSDDEEDPVVAGFQAQASVVSVGVRATLDRAVSENTSLVLDGVSLAPGLIDLSAYRDVAHVVFLVVARLDEDAFRSHFVSREARQRRRSAERYVGNLDAILRIQDYFLEQADRFDVPIVDNTTIDGSVLLIIRHVLETLRKADGRKLEDLR